jgi:AhpC/TSA family
MANFVSRAFGVVVLATLLGMTLTAAGPRQAGAVEVGEPAPPFKLAATTGVDISLNDFRNKKWVLLEFYGADFTPT